MKQRLTLVLLYRELTGSPALSKPGLGTGIVDAMARQLDAKFSHADANPGTSASVTHASNLSLVCIRPIEWIENLSGVLPSGSRST